MFNFIAHLNEMFLLRCSVDVNAMHRSSHYLNGMTFEWFKRFDTTKVLTKFLYIPNNEKLLYLKMFTLFMAFVWCLDFKRTPSYHFVSAPPRRSDRCSYSAFHVQSIFHGCFQQQQ